MDMENLIKEATEGGMVSEVGKAFFADKTRTNEQTHDFITALLERGAYESLAAVMSFGYIENERPRGYDPNRKQMGRLSDRYFRTFMELVRSAEVDMELVYPMLFAAFDAPKDSYLYSFVGGIDAYFSLLTYNNYDAAADIMHRYDKKYKCLSTLMAVDRARTLETVLDDLIYGKNINKTVLRKRLLEKRVDIVPSLCREYLGAKVHAKEGIVRLLLLYKSDPRAQRFLEEILRNEKSVTIVRLITKDRNARTPREEECEDVVPTAGSMEVNGVEYTLKPTPELTVQVEPTPYPAAVKAAVKALEKQMAAICAECEEDMKNNVRIPAARFVGRLESDPLFAIVASTLLFSTYNYGTMSDIITVENGEIHDLNNKKRELSEEEVAVSHPAEWEKFEFLKRLNVKQPFEQVDRAVYTPTDADKTYNSCGRVRNRLMQARDFKTNLNKVGFKLLNKNRYDESSAAGLTRDGIMCVLEFDPTNFANGAKLVAMGDIRFYRYADLIKLGGQIYTDGVMPHSVRDLPPILFSEFVRDVFRVLTV